MKPIRDNVDGFCVSFHKLYGPTGCGLLVVKREWLEGYQLKPLIFGTQNSGMRGGTENMPAIGGSRLALSLAMLNRAHKNKDMLSNKKYIFKEISSRAPSRSYSDYVARKSTNEIEVIFFDESLFRDSGNYLPNTIFLSIIKRSHPPMCNTNFKNTLEKNNIIISVGSACNTASENASHVLYSLGADELIRKGALRISLGDTTTREECKKFVMCFLQILSECVKQNHLAKRENT
jgi:cysteine desulfurase